MAVLVSPGISISVIDQSINVGAGPGSVPLIFIATQQDKADPTGTSVAVGTTKANAGKVYSITSQRDLVSTFGDPVFYSVSGTSLNGYPLNEYGLLTAYSYLGISNLARVVRADIDTAALEATPIAPTSPAAVNTYWLDESAAGSSYGIFVRSGIAPNEIWTSVTPKYVYNFASGSANVPTAGGTVGAVAVVFQTASGQISYWEYTSYLSGTWSQIGSYSVSQSIPKVLISSVWPDLNTVTEKYWLKTSTPAQGANIVLRRMDATVGSFIQLEAPILATDAAANTYYATDTLKSTGQIYIQPIQSGAAPTENNTLEFKIATGTTGPWAPLTTVVGSSTVPTQGPTNGQLWFNSLLALDSNGHSTVDVLISDGLGSWKNVRLPGYSTQTVIAGTASLYLQALNPLSNTPVPTLIAGDIWVNTELLPYPVINRWSGSAWVLVNNEDQTTPSGVIFQDARPNPLYMVNGTTYQGQNNGGGTHPDLDADAPQAALYPKGFLLWNTRYSSNNVKSWSAPYVYDGVTASTDNTNSNSTGRWVTISGNNASGKPYMGAAAQQIAIVKAIQSTIISNEEIRAEDMYFNLIAAPGYVEAIDEMVLLNADRKETAFVVGDTPFTLNSSGTALQNWATNASSALGNGPDGLVTSSKYLATWYPSGLSTNVDGTDVVVPPSHMALRTIAYNDQVAYPWFAPAGLQRGVVNNAASVGYVNSSGQFVPVKLNEGQRDILYNNSINPIRTMPTGSIVVFGQKTRQAYSSATDRINVVRLENYLRYQMNALSEPFLFEPNDSTTRKAVKDAFDRFLSELITLRALYDFLVVCDLGNNTPARIDRNELWIDVAIQPVKAVEFIYIPIRIKNTGASLT